MRPRSTAWSSSCARREAAWRGGVPDGAFLLLGQNGVAKYQFGIPGDPKLVGLRFYNQALVLDAAANALGAVVSDAAEVMVGHF